MDLSRDEAVNGSCYCRCGSMFRFRIRGADARASPDTLAALFWQSHTGDEHGKATQQECARARNRAERALPG